MTMQTHLSSEVSSISVADAGSGAKTSRFMGLDWEKYRPLLHQLYVDEDRSLEQVMEYMHKEFGFNAKKRIYKMKFKLWEIEKNIPARDMKAIVALVEKRKREHGKDSQVYYKGRLVDARKMDRFRKRKLAATTSDEEDSTASHLRCCTPPVGCTTPPGTISDDSRQSLVQPLDLESLGDAILNEYCGDSVMYTTTNKSPKNPPVANLFAQASRHASQNRTENAESAYRQLLNLPDSQKDIGSVLDALRGIVQLHSTDLDFRTIILELERLVAGCLCLFGPHHQAYQELALTLAITYYDLKNYADGNAIVKRILTAYSVSAAPINKTFCLRFLERASFWTFETALDPLFKALYIRLVKRCQAGEDLASAIELALGITKSLQDAALYQEAEFYLRSAHEMYESQGISKLRFVDSLVKRLTEQCLHFGAAQSWIDEALLDRIMQDKSLESYLVFGLLAICYTVLGKGEKACGIFLPKFMGGMMLAAGWSAENWEVLISGLVLGATRLKESRRCESAVGLLVLARDLAVKELGAGSRLMGEVEGKLEELGMIKSFGGLNDRIGSYICL